MVLLPSVERGWNLSCPRLLIWFVPQDSHSQVGWAKWNPHFPLYAHMCKVKWPDGKNGQMCKYTCVQIYKQRRIVSPPGGFAEALPSLANSHSPISVQLCSPSLLLFYTTFGLVTSHYPFFFHFSLLIKYFCFFRFQLPFCFLPFVYIHFAVSF